MATSLDRDYLQSLNVNERKPYVLHLSDDKKTCPLCHHVYKGLSKHVNTCIDKFLLAFEKEKESKGSTNRIMSIDQDYLQSLNSDDRKTYVLKFCNDGKTCPLCDIKYKGLSIHLTTCIKKFLLKFETKREFASPDNSTKASVSSTDQMISIDQDHLQSLNSDGRKTYVLKFSNDGKTCPLCGTEFICLSRHVTTCIKKFLLKFEKGRDSPSSDDSTKVATEGAGGMSNMIKKSQDYVDSYVAERSPDEIDEEAKVLEARLQQMSLTKNEIKKTSETMTSLTKYLTHYLNKYPIANLTWDILNSGSFYEKTKIYEMDEVDCMLTFKIPLPKESYKVCCSGKSKSYVSLHILDDEWANASGLCTRDGFLSPALLRAAFHGKVTEALQKSNYKSRGILLDIQDPLSPAMRLKKRNGFDIDVVPGIELQGWPEVSSNWRRLDILDRYVDTKKVYHLVAKCHHSEHDLEPKKCKLWRLSFSQTEKRLMLRLDESSNEGKTFRKNILRLLKSDVMAARMYCGETDYTKSYIAKTIILHMLQIHPEPEYWLKATHHTSFLKRYKQALFILKECIQRYYLEHAFIPGENILGHENDILVGFIDDKLCLKTKSEV